MNKVLLRPMIKRIPINKVEVGMYVSANTPGLSAAGVLEKGMIRRESTIAKLRNHNIGEVYIDVDKGKDSHFALPVIDHPVSLEPTVSLAEERVKAERVYGEATGLVGSILTNVKLGKAIEIGPVEDLAYEINNSVLRNANALLCLSQIQDKDKYLLEHSINVGILIGVFARYLGYDRETVHQLVTGGLLHDIGKVRVPYNVLNKPGKLTNNEWVLMRKHVEYGVETLAKTPGIHPVSAQICALHHEKLDGSGYPNQLQADDISIYGRIASVVDIYDAVTAVRVYHEGRNPFKAMKLLHELAGKHLDKELVYNFIRCMSVYPVGSIIELSNGKLGIVITTRQGSPDRPLVRVFYNLRLKHYETPTVVDLAKPQVGLRIVGIHEASTLGIDANKYL